MYICKVSDDVWEIYLQYNKAFEEVPHSVVQSNVSPAQDIEAIQYR